MALEIGAVAVGSMEAPDHGHYNERIRTRAGEALSCTVARSIHH